MKKKVILMLSILALIITFLLMSTLYIYHFGNIINVFALLYILSFYLIIAYFFDCYFLLLF